MRMGQGEKEHFPDCDNRSLLQCDYPYKCMKCEIFVFAIQGEKNQLKIGINC